MKIYCLAVILSPLMTCPFMPAAVWCDQPKTRFWRATDGSARAAARRRSLGRVFGEISRFRREEKALLCLVAAVLAWVSI